MYSAGKDKENKRARGVCEVMQSWTIFRMINLCNRGVSTYCRSDPPMTSIPQEGAGCCSPTLLPFDLRKVDRLCNLQRRLLLKLIARKTDQKWLNLYFSVDTKSVHREITRQNLLFLCVFIPPFHFSVSLSFIG